MLGERVSAAQALDWGLVNRVFADEDFAARERRADGALGGRADALLCR